MCICHIPYGYLSIDLCVIDMSGPVQAGRYPSLGLLRLHHLHVVEVLPGKKRMTLQEVREREMMKEAAMQKDPKLRDAILTSISVFSGAYGCNGWIFVFCNRPFVFLKLWYFSQVFASYNVTDGKSFSPRTRDNCGGWPWGFLEGNLEI